MIIINHGLLVFNISIYSGEGNKTNMKTTSKPRQQRASAATAVVISCLNMLATVIFVFMRLDQQEKEPRCDNGVAWDYRLQQSGPLLLCSRPDHEGIEGLCSWQILPSTQV